MLLWSIQDEENLSDTARQIILDMSSRKYVSMASLWEIAIKNRIGKLTIDAGITSIFNEINNNGYGLLGIDQECIEVYNTLPLIHRDPFDGMIVATAILEQLTIVTVDDNIRQYNASWIW